MARIKGTSGNDNLVGTASNDTLIGGSGNDNLSGGTGTDTAQYAGNIADYRFSNVDGKLVVTNDAEGKDTLTSVETLQLGNGQLSLTSGQLLVSANNVDSFTNVISKHITTLADGGFVVAWTSYEHEGEFGEGYGVFAQRFDALGVAQGSEFLVNTTITLEQYEPSITALADGGFVVTWTGGFVADADIFAQRFDASGNKQGAEFVVNTTTALNQDASNVIALADGSFVVIWHSNDTGGIGVFAQRFDVNGNKLGTEFQVNTELTNHQYFPDITTLVDGGFVITWTSLEQNGSFGGIFAQRYDASGAAQGLEFQVNTYTTSEQGSSKVTALSNGGFVITWISQGQDSDGYGIYAQRYDANGNKQGTEFQVNTYTPSNQFVSGITTLVDGGFVVTWQSAFQDGDDYGIYAQRYDASGNRLGNEFRVNTDTIGTQGQAGITALADGGFVVDWTSRNPSNGAGTIYAQRYDAAGNAVGLKLTGTNNTEIINLDAGTAGLVVDGLAGNDTINGASNNDTLLGGAGKDTLKGNAGNDHLDGGADADKMLGGTGDDVYVINHIKDTVIELANAGVDTVQSSITHTLGKNVENLTLTLTGNINGTGNAQANGIIGNTGNNRLDGKAGADVIDGGAGNDTLIGGTGNDFLTGGAGNDTFRFNTKLNALNNVDEILDFNVTDDTIQLSKSIFSKIGAASALGTELDASAFYTGSAANDASDRIIYNSTTGDLYYDKDGTGAAAAIKFAHLDAGLSLTNADFSVIL